MVIEYFRTKDGPNFEILWEKIIDIAKPKAYIEGFEYKFNFTLTKVERYATNT